MGQGAVTGAAKRLLAVLREERANLKSNLPVAEKALRKARRRQREARKALARHASRARLLGWLPVLGDRVRRKGEALAAAADRAQRRASERTDALLDLRARAAAADGALTALREAGAVIAKADRLPLHRAVVPPGVAELLRGTPKDASEAARAARRLAAGIGAWARRVVARDDADAAAHEAVTARLHELGVDLSWIRRLTALIHDKSGEVPLVMTAKAVGKLKECDDRGEALSEQGVLDLGKPDAEKYAPLLPWALSRRRLLGKMDFAPVPPTARKINMRNVFTEESWAIVRGQSASRTREHCIVCGRRCWHSSEERVGVIKSTNPRSDGHRHGGLYLKYPEIEDWRGLDCHEVWEWKILGGGVGVQRLKDILPMCVDCHKMWHRDQLTDVGVDYALLLRAVVSDLGRWPMLEAEERAGREDRRAAALAEKAQVWVLDLSELVAISDRIPMSVPVVRNPEKMPAGFAADLIAGVRFMADGAAVGPRTVEECAQAAARLLARRPSAVSTAPEPGVAPTF